MEPHQLSYKICAPRVACCSADMLVLATDSPDTLPEHHMLDDMTVNKSIVCHCILPLTCRPRWRSRCCSAYFLACVSDTMPYTASASSASANWCLYLLANAANSSRHATASSSAGLRPLAATVLLRRLRASWVPLDLLRLCAVASLASSRMCCKNASAGYVLFSARIPGPLAAATTCVAIRKPPYAGHYIVDCHTQQ